ATREDLNTDKSVKRITVQWPDVSKPLFVRIDYVVGMYEAMGGMAAPTFMVLKPATAQVAPPAPLFTGFDETQPPAPLPVNKTALKNLITLAGKAKKADYTAASYTALSKALTAAKKVYANANATQAQVDSAYKALLTAYNGLKAVSTSTTMEVGKTYLVDIYPALSDGSGAPSSNLVGLYYQKAIVEVKKSGNVVTFFHSKSPTVTIPGQTPQVATPSVVKGYKYDTSQSSTRAAAELSMKKVPIEELNADKSVKRVVVPWPNVNKPLFMTIASVPGMPKQLLPAPTFMVLKPATAQLMTTNPFPEFSDSGVIDAKPQTVSKTSLQDLIKRAAAVDTSKYTSASAGKLATALKSARSVLADPKATQAQVNAALVALQAALDGLELLPTQMADGRYTVRVAFWHATLDKPSMANDSLNKTAIIDVKNGKMTMSISTSPIRVGDTVTALGTLVVNGSNASVIANNITINGAAKPSAFRFPLPNKNTYQPVVFWLNPQISQTPRPDLPGRLRIYWDTFQAASANTALSTNTAITNIDKANLDEIKRSAETTTAAAPEPVLGSAQKDNSSNESTGLGGAVKKIARKLPWYAWAAIGVGVVGVCAVGGVLIKKNAAAKKGKDSDEASAA
ncbi:MAG: NEAT domain-containing protein, partial [Coriobacteriia bacterium]|nr:NEAT domain-containing protein [Coriobacteriia bacterium]